MPRWTKADVDRHQARAIGCEPGIRNQASIEGAESQRPVCREPLGTQANQESHPERFWIRVESVRTVLLDQDNLCPKAFIDCLRYAGLIRDDSTKHVRSEATQRKAEKGEEEHTLINVWRI